MGVARITGRFVRVVFVCQIQHDSAGFKDAGRRIGASILDGRDTPVRIDLQEPWFLIH